MPALKEYRENPARAVFVTGDIDEGLVHRLTPEICRLRGTATDPITVYINSRGGYTYCAEQIRAFLATPDQEGRSCRTITVATSRADSAAAGLLALGDYAVAYPAAAIYCHGSRMADKEITTERAEFLAASLKKSDDAFALRMARRTFARMAFHYANLQNEFEGLRNHAREKKWKRPMSSDLECFAFAIYTRLSRDFGELPQRAFFHHERLTEMTAIVLKQVGEIHDSTPLIKTEAKILKRLIDFELKTKKAGKWSLSDGGIDELALDFKSLADYLYGPHRAALEEHLESFGIFFLKPDELSEYQRVGEKDKGAANEWLLAQAKPLVEPMWYFVVSLCRLLQNGEYSLNATDAYWLGMVDEVIGERLPSLRLIAENPET